jgi:CBS domain-containing protein
VKVQSIMTTVVFACRPDDSLEEAARLLWEHDCGSLPVLDASGLVSSVITDRDICMGAYTSGRPLSELKVSSAMSSRLITCQPGEDIEEAARKMCEHALRRLPVVDARGALQGILSINDVVRASSGDSSDPNGSQALRVLDAVSQPHGRSKSTTKRASMDRSGEIRPAARATNKGKRAGKGSKA